MSPSDRDRKWYWRSLNEVRNTPEFEQYLHREFPVAASEFPEGVSRRRWMQLMGASFALGAAGCRYQEETFAEFARRPQNRVPGETRQFASAIEFAGVGVPVMATSYDGRPIKLDGHPDHPDIAGGSTAILQATVLDLYDPDRSRAPLRNGEASDWAAFDAFWGKRIAERASGKGLAVLTQRTSSPSLLAAVDRLRARFPELVWFEYDAVSRGGVDAGVAAAWGAPYRLHLDLAAARVIVSIDADPLGRDVDGIRNARGWAQGRDVESGRINRVYAIESQMSTTGMTADHRLPIQSLAIPGFVAALVAAVESRKADPAREVSGAGRERWLDALAQDLVAHAGAAAIVVGPRQSVEVQAAVHRLNALLGNVGAGKPIRLIDVPDSSMAGPGSLVELGAAIDAGAVDTLVVVGGNPVYDAPADVRFKERYGKVEERVHLSLYVDETSAASTWHLNVAHPLESWSDSRAWDGSWCVGQPLIDPLWGGRSPLEFLDALASGVVKSGAELVRATAVAADSAFAKDAAWKQLVHDGYAAGTAATPVDATVVPGASLSADNAWTSSGAGLELVLSPSAFLFDGRYANNGWLQECPDPVTKVVWGNAALLAPSTAEELGVEQNTLIELSVGDVKVEVPAHLVPGQARGSIGLALGYGRTRVGVVGGSVADEIETVGVDAYVFHRSSSTGVLEGLKVRPTGRPFELACTQDHYAIDELGLRTINERVGNLIRQGDWSDYELFTHDRAAWEKKHGGHGEAHGADHSHEEKEAHPAEGESHEGGEGEHKEHDDHAHAVQWPHSHHHFGTFNLNDGPGYDPDQPRWGMSIDLNKCTGCHACVVACQSENNVPVVGKDQVIRGRLMHWLRVDRYYVGDDYDDPQTVMQPVTCHHCENAPCEQVCPVAATVHSDEGLNDMVYNRCIGTRYCANNCPYKVRRFNYLNYSEAVTFLKYPWADKLDKANRALRNLVMNPEVTVRSRGVMEKCTYCVQRIQNGKIVAKREGRSLGDNEITTACQDACPTQAIAFGDLNRSANLAAKGHASPRAYELLGELNVKARTRYLARVRNPHPALVVQQAAEAH